MRPLLLLAGTFALAVLPGPAPATTGLDWTRFRGPNGSGIGAAPNLPAKISEADFNWKIELPGKGHSSPVVAGGKVFVTCTPPESNRRMLVAVNAADGKILWQKEWEAPDFRQHADNSYTSASPAVDAERVYVWWTSPEQSWLAALDQKDGRELWKKELGGFVSQHGAGSSPIVDDDSVILDFGQEGPGGQGSYTICVDARNGDTRWKTSRPSESSTASTPCLFQPPGGGPAQLVLVSRTSGLTSLDPKTGKLNWELPTLIPKRCVASVVASGDGLVIAQCGEGNSESFVYAVRPGKDGKSAEKIYEVPHTGGYVPTPIIVGDRLYLWKENGYVTCLEAGTNKQIWSQQVKGPFYGSPVAVNGRLYSMTKRGELVVIAAADTFEEIARVPLGEGTFATPAISGGRMYLRTFTHLVSVGK